MRTLKETDLTFFMQNMFSFYSEVKYGMFQCNSPKYCGDCNKFSVLRPVQV